MTTGLRMLAFSVIVLTVLFFTGWYDNNWFVVLFSVWMVAFGVGSLAVIAGALRQPAGSIQRDVGSAGEFAPIAIRVALLGSIGLTLYEFVRPHGVLWFYLIHSIFWGLVVFRPSSPRYSWLIQETKLSLWGKGSREAYDLYDERLDPENAEAYVRGYAYQLLGQYERAIKDYNEVIRLSPEYAKAYHNRGCTYQLLDQNEQAERDFAKAKELEDEGP